MGARIRRGSGPRVFARVPPRRAPDTWPSRRRARACFANSCAVGRLLELCPLICWPLLLSSWVLTLLDARSRTTIFVGVGASAASALRTCPVGGGWVCLSSEGVAAARAASRCVRIRRRGRLRCARGRFSGSCVTVRAATEWARVVVQCSPRMDLSWAFTEGARHCSPALRAPFPSAPQGPRGAHPRSSLSILLPCAARGHLPLRPRCPRAYQLRARNAAGSSSMGQEVAINLSRAMLSATARRDNNKPKDPRGRPPPPLRSVPAAARGSKVHRASRLPHATSSPRGQRPPIACRNWHARI